MIATKRKIETEQDRYGGYSVTNPNISYFANQPTQTEIQEDSQQSFNFDTNYNTTYEDESNNTTNYASPDYEVEHEYKVDELNTQESDDGYSIVKTFMPNVERKIAEAPVKHIKQRAVLNSRGKIFVAMYSLVACLLIAFCIYNAIAISAVSNSISLKQQEYETIRNEVVLLNREFTELSSEYSISNSIPTDYSAINSSNTKTVQIEARPEYKAVEETDNWFNAICNFFSNIF